jgi:hypothetical protein
MPFFPANIVQLASGMDVTIVPKAMSTSNRFKKKVLSTAKPI